MFSAKERLDRPSSAILDQRDRRVNQQRVSFLFRVFIGCIYLPGKLFSFIYNYKHRLLPCHRPVSKVYGSGLATVAIATFRKGLPTNQNPQSHPIILVVNHSNHLTSPKICTMDE